MRAYALDELGKPGSVREFEDPTPDEGEVLVRLAAAGINAFDIAVVNGFVKDYMEHRFPLIPGLDGSGVVEAVGAGVDGLKAGDEVYGIVQRGFMGEGTFAQLQIFTGEGLTPKPASLDHTGAAALPTAALTALAAVDAVSPGQGSVIMMLGATGGVGSYATQLLAQRGARVVAVTLGAYADYARSFGASDVLDYTKGDLAEQVGAVAPEGIDALMDFAGVAEAVEAVLNKVRAGGIAVSAAGGVENAALEARGLRGGSVNRAGLDRLPELSRLFEEKQLVLPAIRTLPLDRAADALAEQATRHVMGKLVLTMD